MDVIFDLGHALPWLLRLGHGEDLIPSFGDAESSAQNVTMDEQRDVADEEGLKARLSVMAIVFLVSLFGTRHTLERRVESPDHFHSCVFPVDIKAGEIVTNTKDSVLRREAFWHRCFGVILSTAFVHLLQDAFSSLHHPSVKARWNIEKWTGLIILCSLLLIFIVEYVSTSYVDRLQAYDSEPSSPSASYPATPSLERPNPTPYMRKITPSCVNAIHEPTEYSPLIPSALEPPASLDNRHTQSFSYGHSHAADAQAQSRHHAHSHAISRFFTGHHRHEPRGSHEEHHDRSPRIAAAPVLYTESLERDLERSAGHHHDHCGHLHDEDSDEEASVLAGEHGPDSGKARMGKRRQIVGILVLQMGIMLHSLVIGLTLAITSGSEFTSLVVAIGFHQLFEGLSLGIRISGLPTSNPHGSDPNDKKSFSPLKVTLMFLFAITTPVGILIGLLSFAQSGDYASDVERITSALNTDELVKLMASAFSVLSSGKGVQSPHRLTLQMGNHKTMFMPSQLEGVGTAVKIVSIPTSEKALATTGGLPGSTVVMDEETGCITAIVNARSLTAQRNAAGSLLATQLLGPKEPRSLVAFGAGKQIEAHVDVFIRAYPSINSVLIINRTENERFAKLLSALISRHGAVTINGIGSDSPEKRSQIQAELAEADIICTATSSTLPLFESSSVRSGVHINLVGSYTPQMMEVGSDLIKRAGTIVVDSREACSVEAGEIIQTGMKPGDLVEVGELASIGHGGKLAIEEDKCAEVRRAGDVTIFKSVGVGVQDIAIATLVVHQAQKLGVGTRIHAYDEL
ncbi:hypothetical protein HWV62_12620 [Athelia sp. TMB]|nr:hypothetical protein HWV62_12620 [Athelia sp. TMB]